MTLPVLQGARLTLRCPQVRDAEDIAEGLNDLEVSRWLTVVPFPYGRDDALWFIGECRAGRERSWAITRTGEDRVLGMVGGRDSFGYWLRRDAWGQGMMTEAARLVLGHLFDQEAPDAIRSEYFLGNARSAALLYRLGFRDAGRRDLDCRATGRTMCSQQLELTRALWGIPAPAGV